jgi:hypothetical protein
MRARVCQPGRSHRLAADTAASEPSPAVPRVILRMSCCHVIFIAGISTGSAASVHDKSARRSAVPDLHVNHLLLQLVQLLGISLHDLLGRFALLLALGQVMRKFLAQLFRLRMTATARGKPTTGWVILAFGIRFRDRLTLPSSFNRRLCNSERPFAQTFIDSFTSWYIRFVVSCTKVSAISSHRSPLSHKRALASPRAYLPLITVWKGLWPGHSKQRRQHVTMARSTQHIRACCQLV